jgi:hypothetical protein
VGWVAVKAFGRVVGLMGFDEPFVAGWLMMGSFILSAIASLAYNLWRSGQWMEGDLVSRHSNLDWDLFIQVSLNWVLVQGDFGIVLNL